MKFKYVFLSAFALALTASNTTQGKSCTDESNDAFMRDAIKWRYGLKMAFDKDMLAE